MTTKKEVEIKEKYNKDVPNGNRVKDSKTQVRSLPIKKFEVRESLLTTLYENRHINVVKNIFGASLVGLLLNTVAHDYLEKGEIKVGLGVIAGGFGKLHVAFAIWIVLNICAIVSYLCFNLWANVRKQLTPKAQSTKVWDYFWLIFLLAYYVIQFRMISIAVRYFELPIASSAIVCLEQTRFLMKIHAFVRSNAPQVLQFKTHSDKSLNIAKLSHFIYFLYAPTLIYMNEYPRASKIRWRFVGERLTELVGVIFYYSFLLERFIIPAHKEVGLRPYSINEIFLIICDNFAVGLMFLLLGFYVVLHTTQNLGAELLKFGDRLFYQDWWMSTNYAEYFRLWNMVVGDWLYTYIYKDCYELLVPGNKTLAKLTVFFVSAVVHEWVLTYMFGFFLPALFILFAFFGTTLSFFTLPKNDILNILFWYGLALGNSCLVSFYALEYFVRENIPVENAGLTDFIVPRLLTCNCIV